MTAGIKQETNGSNFNVRCEDQPSRFPYGTGIWYDAQREVTIWSLQLLVASTNKWGGRREKPFYFFLSFLYSLFSRNLDSLVVASVVSSCLGRTVHALFLFVLLLLISLISSYCGWCVQILLSFSILSFVCVFHAIFIVAFAVITLFTTRLTPSWTVDVFETSNHHDIFECIRQNYLFVLDYCVRCISKYDFGLYCNK